MYAKVLKALFLKKPLVKEDLPVPLKLLTLFDDSLGRIALLNTKRMGVAGDISTANGVTTKRAVFWKDVSFFLASSECFGFIHLC